MRQAAALPRAPLSERGDESRPGSEWRRQRWAPLRERNHQSERAALLALLRERGHLVLLLVRRQSSDELEDKPGPLDGSVRLLDHAHGGHLFELVMWGTRGRASVWQAQMFWGLMHVLGYQLHLVQEQMKMSDA